MGPKFLEDIRRVISLRPDRKIRDIVVKGGNPRRVVGESPFWKQDLNARSKRKHTPAFAHDLQASINNNLAHYPGWNAALPGRKHVARPAPITHGMAGFANQLPSRRFGASSQFMDNCRDVRYVMQHTETGDEVKRIIGKEHSSAGIGLDVLEPGILKSTCRFENCYLLGSAHDRL